MVERTVRGFVGVVIIVLALLSHFLPWPFWYIVIGLVGLNLLQSAFTNWCPLMSILKAIGVK